MGDTAKGSFDSHGLGRHIASDESRRCSDAAWRFQADAITGVEDCKPLRITVLPLMELTLAVKSYLLAEQRVAEVGGEIQCEALAEAHAKMEVALKAVPERWRP